MLVREAFGTPDDVRRAEYRGVDQALAEVIVIRTPKLVLDDESPAAADVDSDNVRGVRAHRHFGPFMLQLDSERGGA